MESFFNQAINDNLSLSLQRTFFFLVFNEHNLYIEDDKEYALQVKMDEYASFFKKSKEKIFNYINEFSNKEIFFYLRTQIDYCKELNPKNKEYFELKSKYEKSYDPYPFSNNVYFMTKLEEKYFKLNYKMYLDIYPDLEKLIVEIYDDFQNGNISKNIKEITDIILDNNPVYAIDENINLTMIRKTGRKFTYYDQHVIALLFTYLRENKAILNYEDKSLAKIIHYLTLTSENRLLKETVTELDFVRNGICNIKKYEDEPLKLIGNLKNLVSDILSMIEEDINKIKKKSNT